jgi:hypothetical protein
MYRSYRMTDHKLAGRLVQRSNGFDKQGDSKQGRGQGRIAGEVFRARICTNFVVSLQSTINTILVSEMTQMNQPQSVSRAVNGTSQRLSKCNEYK